MVDRREHSGGEEADDTIGLSLSYAFSASEINVPLRLSTTEGVDPPVSPRRQPEPCPGAHPGSQSRKRLRARAKPGCATQHRSIVERERRRKICGKMKSLQDLIPKLNKQTSYSEMLDLAVQHIKSLRDQVQKLNEELEGCSCGSRSRRKTRSQLTWLK